MVVNGFVFYLVVNRIFRFIPSAVGNEKLNFNYDRWLEGHYNCVVLGIRVAFSPSTCTVTMQLLFL